ncbi:hypothetical protein ACFY6U_34955 [Streptomyces sp. NPDC013157]|uniref:hypothetical protein n=1 Tax=Streptomyces sp. NPDC013157 TaxID=3364861 RepID=UPI00368F0EBC
MNITLGYTMDDLPPYEHTLAEIAVWDRFIEAHPADLLTVRTTADIHGASMVWDMSPNTATPARSCASGAVSGGRMKMGRSWCRRVSPGDDQVTVRAPRGSAGDGWRRLAPNRQRCMCGPNRTGGK